MINYGFLVNKKANEADVTEWWKKNEEWQMIIIKLIHILLVYFIIIIYLISCSLKVMG